MATKAQSACFTVDGDWLADFARTRVIEGRWDHAVKLLETLHGISMDQIIAVLKGDATLTGDSTTGIGFKKANDKKHKQRLDYMFGGAWNNGGRYMRPYALVTAWGPDDMVEKVTSRGRWQHTSIYYANDPQRDVCLHLKCENDVFDHGDVLWAEVTNFPHLIVDASHEAQEALDLWRKDHKLEGRGYMGGREYRNEVDGMLTNFPTAPAGHKESALEKHGITRTFEDNVPETPLSRLFKEPPTELELQEMAAKIREQAGDDWLQVNDELKVPRAPFENWCLWRGDGAHLAMPWKCVAPSGLKMFGDDPYHTDFMLGAGLELDAMRDDNELSRQIWDLRHKVQEEKLGFKCAVLCGTGVSAELKAVHPKPGESCEQDEVAVIPNAGPDYVAAANTAGAVITEQGGAMAHLVTVNREKDTKIVRVPKARELYPVGMHLVVDCSKGDVHVPFNRVDYKMFVGGVMLNVDELPKEEEE